MSEAQPKQKIRLSERPNYGEVVHAQYKDIQGRIDRVEKELDRVNIRLDRVDAKIDDTRRELYARMDKQDEKIEKLADKIDALHNEIKSSTSHGQISTISTIGIALAVIYSLFTR